MVKSLGCSISLLLAERNAERGDERNGADSPDQTGWPVEVSQGGNEISEILL